MQAEVSKRPKTSPRSGKCTRAGGTAAGDAVSSEALERLASLVVTGTIVAPPITVIKLDDVPTLNRDAAH